VSGRRRLAVWLLVVLASVIAFLATLTTWVDRQLLDDNTWQTTSRKLVEDPEVRDSLSVYLVNQLYQNVNVGATLRQQLPPRLDPLAAPVAAALREPLANAVGQLLQRPRVQELWVTASSNTHERLVNVLENKTGEGVTAGDGTVTLQLGALLQRLSAQLGLPGKVVAKLPPDAGTIVLLKSSQLSAAQAAVQTVRTLSRWLLVLVLAMYALAAYLARGERRVTIRRVGWAFVLVGLALLVVRKIAGNYVIDAVTSPAYRGTGHRVWLIGTTILGEIGSDLVLYGLVLVVAMVLAGGTTYARRLRDAIAPTLIARPEIAWTAAGGLLLALVLWGPTHALRAWWGVLLFAVLIAAGIVALRRQLIEEAAEAATAPDGTPIPQSQGRKKLALQ
jgi:hypothetical protein